MLAAATACHCAPCYLCSAGIALTPAGDVWVTGKLWPRMYRVEVEREASSHKDLTWARKLCIPT